MHKKKNKQKLNKIGQFSGTNISRNTKAIHFNFDMGSSAYSYRVENI